jgi:hypothetical protein
MGLSGITEVVGWFGVHATSPVLNMRSTTPQRINLPATMREKNTWLAIILGMYRSLTPLMGNKYTLDTSFSPCKT